MHFSWELATIRTQQLLRAARARPRQQSVQAGPGPRANGGRRWPVSPPVWELRRAALLPEPGVWRTAARSAAHRAQGFC